MGSDIVFYGFYLDKCLRFGWHLDIVMFFLLGDTSLMFKFVSAMFGLRGSRVWWEMISCHLFFWLVAHPMSYWGIFPFRMRFADFQGGHMFDERWFHVTRFLTYHTFDAILGYIFVLDEIYRSWWSCALIPICETYAEMMIYSLSWRWFLSRASC